MGADPTVRKNPLTLNKVHDADGADANRPPQSAAAISISWGTGLEDAASAEAEALRVAPSG
jgi:hypothetical protein